MANMDEMNLADFHHFQKLIYEKAGINLTDKKKTLLTNRIRKRILGLHLDSYRKYFEFVSREENFEELVKMIDAVTTNVTDFFRHNKQFDAFAAQVVPALLARNAKRKSLRVLSAGCSTGEEPYTIAMILLERFGDQLAGWDVRIDAIDISTAVLQKAEDGIYPAERMKQSDCGDGVPPRVLEKYFSPAGTGTYKIRDSVKRLVRFHKFNLTQDSFKTDYDAIFCRNVVIYFDKETKMGLYARFHKALVRQGYMLVGYSEGLLGDERFKYVCPGIYQKNEPEAGGWNKKQLGDG